MKRALLIGVPTFQRPEIRDLPVIRRDLAALKEVLHGTGYEDVRVRGESPSTEQIETTRSRIAYEIRSLCRDAGDGDTLLVYLSSHGIHHGGRDYLVPSDAWWDDPRDFDQTLLPIDFAAYAGQSRAATLVVFIDACREGVDIGTKAVAATQWTAGQREKARDRHLVLCFACQPGEFAGYVAGEDGFSLLARALATVLDIDHPARTLRQVCEAVQSELDSLSRAHGKPRQHIRTAIEMELGGQSALERDICSGTGSRRAATATDNPWTEHALGAELWHREDVQACPWLGDLRDGVRAIIDAAWRMFCARETETVEPSASRGGIAGDPWTDIGLPGRVVDALGLLSLRAEPVIALNPGETALCVIAPFVHEAALWAIAGADLASAVESSRRAYPQLVRKQERLAAQGISWDSDAIVAWLSHKARLRFPTAALPGALHDAIRAAATGAAGTDTLAGGRRVVAETLRPERIFSLSRCVIAEPTAVQRDDRPTSLAYEVPAGGHGPDRRVREKLCGYLLLLASRLAVDPRMLADVVVEHLGLSDPVEPGRVVDAAARVTWRLTRVGLIAAGQCSHPAIDLALRQHVHGISDELELVHKAIAGDRDSLAPLQALPVRAAADELVPAVSAGGTASFELPHVSFHLATGEVQEMLMGEQLYGDPSLAIRELYQNALDACRYRQARLTYLQRSDQIGAPAWQGNIVFRQGEYLGRPYIECEDNGIGMDRRVLAESFARAGKRFHDSPEFIEEQSEWQSCDPPVEMVPNSQFGIGVFSYFMLADEIEVTTCRLDRNGRPGQALNVYISGSGSLFRVRPAAVPMAGAGTRVRLYLGKTEEQDSRGNVRPISCFRTLRRELWVAEFTTTTVEGGKSFSWRPGELVHPNRKARQILATESPHLWWVSHHGNERVRGAILADGLLVDERQSCFVVNLVGAHRPRLTVDRTRALEVDRGWIRRLLADHVEICATWTEVDLDWLNMLLDESSHRVAETLAQRLVENNVQLRAAKRRVPIARVGWFPLDRKIIDFTGEREIMLRHQPGAAGWPGSGWLLKHRLEAWRQAVSNAPADPLLCASPLDAVLLSRDLDGEEPWIDTDVSVLHMERAAKGTGCSLDEVRRRLGKFARFGLRVPQ